MEICILLRQLYSHNHYRMRPEGRGRCRASSILSFIAAQELGQSGGTKKHHVIYRPERHIVAKTANEFFLLKNDLIARLFRLIIFNICWKSISPYIQSGRLFDTADDVWGEFPLSITGNTVFENFHKQRCYFQR